MTTATSMRKGARPARRLRHRSRSQAFGARVDRVVARPLARDLRTRVPRRGARDREVLRSSRRKRSSSRSIGRLNAGWVDFGAVQELKKRVIVIGEDDEPIAMLLRDALNDEAGYQAVVATGVGDAIAVEDTAIVTRKRGRANFATAADHAAERTILERLAAHDAGVPVLTEESPRKDLARAERLWVVDPIDGTLNFSRGLPFYCVLIGYVEEGRVRAAAVHAPRTGETFLASEGAGATRNRIRIKVSSVVKPSEAFAVASLQFAETAKPGSRFAILNATCARLRVIGSAGLEIAYVAMGRLDLFVHSALSPWDIAAASLVAREAGAAVLSLKTGGDATWNEREVVIANPNLARETMKLLVKPRM